MSEENAAVAVQPDGKKKGIDKWEVDSAVESLLRAEEIKANKPLMKEVMKKLDGKKTAISSLQELRSVADEKNKEASEE